ncbi:NB-ARC domain-containing protein [Leptolyngbya sp. FACHB-261]|uniref:NB-ARC domain-containing protein n=1 Tax=Leptolyngbya sp. FACHB-261 TaxID=2692806 RepID=UPI0016869E74|nr:NB-ARC domain-containing protein [Leptolyngbya sp. FACHB-261]MBD2103169.1 tetratricopeptide repeat protein [Leptolyngbya sp. FACHB-261]
MSVEVFIAFARKDEELGQELENHLSILRRQGVIQAWHSHLIQAGQDTQAEIETRLDAAQVILLLVSSDFLASDDCYDVQLQRAIERHEAGTARVIPVILRSVDWRGAPFARLQALPKDGRPVMSWANRDEAFTDIAQGIREAIEGLRGEGERDFSPGPSPARGGGTDFSSSLVGKGVGGLGPGAFEGLGKFLTAVPTLPPHFLPRPDNLRALKDKVLAQAKKPVAVIGQGQRLGVQGMGGIGKTVLTTALARDEEIRRQFPDGVLWLTLGQEPVLTSLQLEAVRTLGGSAQTLASEREGKARLSELLAERACLLVLDDVWEARHAAAFEVVGPRCQLVITTRNLEPITLLGATEHRLDLLSEEQALTLLADWSGLGLAGLPEQAQAVARECGYLPLALAMVGAMVRGKLNRWGAALHRLQSADLAKLRQEFPGYAYPDLLKAMAVSVEVLEPQERQCYLDFAVFPEDVLLPEAVLRTLWQPQGLDEYDTQDVLERLVDRSLLRRDEQGRLSLHDLQRDYVRSLAGDLAALHERLVNTYAARCPQGWSSGPNDGYFFEHLAHHLKAAGRSEELYRLLTESPDWMEAKFAACTGDSAYVADLELAIGDFADPLKPNQLLTLSQLYTARQVVQQRVSRYTNTDLATLVWLGREAEALSHARLKADANSRFNSLLAVYQALCQKGEPNSSLLQEAHKVAQGIEDSYWRVEAFRELAKALSQSGQAQDAAAVLRQAQEVAQSIEGSDNQARAFIEIAKALAQAGQLRVQEVIQGIEDSRRREEAFIEIAKALAQAGQFRQAQEVAQGIEDRDSQARAFRDLAKALAQAGQFRQAQEVAQGIEDSSSRAGAFRELAKALAQVSQAQEAAGQFRQAQEMAQGIEDSSSRAWAFRELVTALAQAGQFRQAQEVAQGIEVRDWQAWAFRELVTALAQAGQFRQAQEVAQGIEDSSSRAGAFGELAKALAQVSQAQEAAGQFRQAQEMAQGIEDSSSRAWAFRELVTALAQAGQFRQAQEMAQGIKDSDSRARAFSELATALAQAGQFRQAQEVAQSIEDSHSRARAFSELATALAQAGQAQDAAAILRQAQEVAQSIEDSDRRARAFSKLATALAQAGQAQEAAAVFRQAQEVAQSIEGSGRREEVFREIATALSQAGQFNQAQEVAQSIEESYRREDTFSELAKALAQAGQFNQAQEVAQSIEDSHRRARAFSKLATALAQAGQAQDAAAVLRQAQEVAQSIEESYRREDAFSELATALSQAGQFNQAQEVAQGIEDSHSREEAFRDLAKALAQVGQFRQAQEVAVGIEDSDWRAGAFRELAQSLATTMKFVDAFPTLRLRELSELLSALAKWVSAFEKVEPRLSAKVLREAVRIAGWVSPNWQKIHELLNPASDA